MKALLLLLLALPASSAGNVRVNAGTKAKLNLPASVVTAGQPLLANTIQPGVLKNAPVIPVQDNPKVQLESLTAELGGAGDGSSEAPLNKAFDRALPGDAGGAVVAEPSFNGELSLAEKHAAAELSAYRAHAQRFPKAVETGWSKRAWEIAEVGAVSLPFHIASLIALANGSPWAPAIQAAIWSLGHFAFTHRLADLRSTVVGGWQASHDQKYRVGQDGRMRDVRGHKYGSDRYEEYAPGPVSTREKLALASASAAAAVLWTLLGLN